MYKGEIHRCLDRVDLREKLRLDYDITEEQYRSNHEVSGEVRANIIPNKEAVRSRAYQPSNPIQSAVESLTGSETKVGDGYPGTDFMVAITRKPPMISSDEEFQSGFSHEEFTVTGVPENGTITLSGDWNLDQVRNSLGNDEQKLVSQEYEVDGLRSDQLPVVIRAKLKRDAREYIENLQTEIDQQDRKTRKGGVDLKEVEGLAVLSIQIEYREDSPELDVAGGAGKLYIENFRIDMRSTFPNIFFSPREGSTYNPERKRVEWRKRKAKPGDTLQYDIFGRMGELLDMENISATVRGVISGDSLTGTDIRGIYDETGTDLRKGSGDGIHLGRGVTVTGDIKIDPTALRDETRKVMDASISLNDTPFDAFDRLQTVCNREGMTISSSTGPSDPEPMTNREGVFAITKGEKKEADDEPGELEVKREYGDQGVVYAHMLVYGRMTGMSQNQELSQASGNSDKTENRMMRADDGALGDRGKSTIEIKARSADAELNTKFIQTIQDGLGGGST